MFQELEDGQDFFTPDEKIVMQYMELAATRTKEIGARKTIDCNDNLYGLKILPLNKSLSKSIEIGIDPNKSYNIVATIRDKKTGLGFGMTIEGVMYLILQMEFLLKLDYENQFSRCAYSGNIVVSYKDNDVYELSQEFALLAAKKMLIHKTSMLNLIKMKNVFPMYATFYNNVAEKFIGYIKKYVCATRAMIKEGKQEVIENKLYLIEKDILCPTNLEGMQQEFLADTKIKFSAYFESFFE